MIQWLSQPLFYYVPQWLRATFFGSLDQILSYLCMFQELQPLPSFLVPLFPFVHPLFPSLYTGRGFLGNRLPLCLLLANSSPPAQSFSCHTLGARWPPLSRGLSPWAVSVLQAKDRSSEETAAYQGSPELVLQGHYSRVLQSVQTHH